MEPQKKYPCPLCGSPNQLFHERGYDICRVCGWEDDEVQFHHHDAEGANGLTFNEARTKWEGGQGIYPQFPKDRITWTAYGQ